MRRSKLVIALGSLLLLSSCGGNGSSSSGTRVTPGPSATIDTFSTSSTISVGPPSSTTIPAPSSSSSTSIKTVMEFLDDGEFFIFVPSSVTETVDGLRPKVMINGIAVEGGLKYTLNDAFTLGAEGTFAHDLYISIAICGQDGRLSARVYSAIEREYVNEALALIAESIGVPNKLFISLSITQGSWAKGYDKEMDDAIQALWDSVE